MTNKERILVIYRALVSWDGDLESIIFNVCGRDIRGRLADDCTAIIVTDTKTNADIIEIYDDGTTLDCCDWLDYTEA